MDDFTIIFVDLIALFKGIHQDDLAIPALFLGWIVILSLPMTGIDRRDPIAALTYVGVVTSLGVLLTQIAPTLYMERQSNLAHDLLSALMMGGVGSGRWFIGRNKTLSRKNEK